MADTRGSTFGCLLVLVVGAFAVYGVVEALNGITRRHTPEADYSAGYFRGSRYFVPLPANPRRLVMTLMTSWVADDHRSGDRVGGTLRYLVDVSFAAGARGSDEQADSFFLSRVASCSMSFDLQDKDGFKLATTTLTTVRMLDTDQNVVSLHSSDAMPMNRSAYLSIADWSPTWRCF